MGRGSYENIIKIVKTKGSDWSPLGYYIFDYPASPAPYEQRMKQLEDMRPFPSFVHLVESIECGGSAHLNDYLDSMLEKEGEGIMAREPRSLYSAGMTNSLLKVKVWSSR